jgi:membrane peptidoglycan carboxypeptidase
MLIETASRRAKARRAERVKLGHGLSPRLAFLALLGVVGGLLGLLELQTSWLQSRVFTGWARAQGYSIEPGPSGSYRHPHSGPYDIRLGHSLLSDYLARLDKADFSIESQARLSPSMVAVLDRGLNPIYDEKIDAGLRITDRRGEFLHRASYPERVYTDFDVVPPLVVNTLLFIENREALDSDQPYKNPAVEWDRLAGAVVDLSLSRLGVSRDVAGGSTLATQLEKIRHSPGGRTDSPTEKLRQMTSASLRAYAGGLETAEPRRKIVVDYLNSMPLAAVSGFGEVHGLGDGLWAWFGADFDDVNLRLTESPPSDLRRRAQSYREVLTLLLAIKRPTAFLVQDRESLNRRVESYLHLLAAEGIIDDSLRDIALKTVPAIRRSVETVRRGSFAERKATDGVRVELLKTLGVRSVYELDRLDMSVETTLDAEAQRRVHEFLERLRGPEFAGRARLLQHRLLAQGDPAGVIYSVTVYERGADANYLRIQSDNLDQPLNISEGTKLELGSTAKLRTLISYLTAVAELHGRLAPMSPQDRPRIAFAGSDYLTQWAIEYFGMVPDSSLEQMLEAALSRGYSASPNATFFTGGGLHRFTNFDPKDNTRVVSVREAFQRSVNLVFVRLMRELVNYRTYRMPEVSADLLTNPDHPSRSEYLARFADREGRQFLTQFYQKYQGLKTDQALHRIAADIRKTPRRLAAIYRSVRPEASVNLFAAYLIGESLNPNLSDELIDALYDEFEPGAYGLVDRAYLAGVDPLELWLVQYRTIHPAAGLGEVFRASGPYCQASYNWLFKRSARRAQDRAIRTMLEVDAFRELHADWRRLGYPFRWLVPSLATALGSSCDTPAALADLMGILATDGRYNPSIRVEKVHLAQDTPFETNLRHAPVPGEQVIPVAVARLVREALNSVVEVGTAIRARNALQSEDRIVKLGGKTGTGDNRFEMYGPGGQVVSSRVINRTATFVFVIDDRFFGTVTAYVAGEAAAEYGFTSSLPVQIFRELAPVFGAMMAGEPPPDLVGAIDSRALPVPKPAEETDAQDSTAEVPAQTESSTPPQTAGSLSI